MAGCMNVSGVSKFHKSCFPVFKNVKTYEVGHTLASALFKNSIMSITCKIT